MTRIRAKFQCISEARTIYCTEDARQYRFEARYDPDLPEDQRFSKATPTGSLEITVDNPSARFDVGQHYYLDFVPADDSAPAGSR